MQSAFFFFFEKKNIYTCIYEHTHTYRHTFIHSHLVHASLELETYMSLTLRLATPIDLRNTAETEPVCCEGIEGAGDTRSVIDI